MAYDATYAFTHLLNTLQQTTPAGRRFDATTALTKALDTARAGGAVPGTVPAAVVRAKPTDPVASVAAAKAVQTYQVEKPKGKKDNR